MMDHLKLPLFFWGKNVAIGMLSLFFLAMGIDVLLSAYERNNPMEFLIFFFASNLMILISAVGLLYPVMQIRKFLKTGI
jgi:hypothetical protein